LTPNFLSLPFRMSRAFNAPDLYPSHGRRPAAPLFPFSFFFFRSRLPDPHFVRIVTLPNAAFCVLQPGVLNLGTARNEGFFIGHLRRFHRLLFIPVTAWDFLAFYHNQGSATSQTRRPAPRQNRFTHTPRPMIATPPPRSDRACCCVQCIAASPPSKRSTNPRLLVVN